MISSDDILVQAAQDGSIDIAEWPRVLESVLQRLHNIVHNDFPIPRVPLPAPLSSSIDPEVVASTPPGVPQTHTQDDSLPDASDNDPLTQPLNSQSSQKENDAPVSTADAASASQPDSVPDTTADSSQLQPTDEIEAPSGTLPPDLLSMFTNSARVLERDFSRSPPYTIQRLAELVLWPRRHYRYLPSYLRALDRVISVSSPVSDFPLPYLQTSPNGGFLSNGDVAQVNGNRDNGLGSDESLGGALLTPISWLKDQPQQQQDGEFHSQSTETIEGPNGAGRIETVTVTVNGVTSASSAAHTTPNQENTEVQPSIPEQADAVDAHLRDQGAVTQGELLRQEQKAGVVPVAQSVPRRQHLVSGAIAVGREIPSASAENLTDETPGMLSDASLPPTSASEGESTGPHARGPEEIGMEDIGSQEPQHTSIDIEAAVGRQKSPNASSPQPLQMMSPPPTAPQAEEQAATAENDDSGAPVPDSTEFRAETEKLRAGIRQELHQLDEQAAEDSKAKKDGDGDVVVADVDGRPVE